VSTGVDSAAGVRPGRSMSTLYFDTDGTILENDTSGVEPAPANGAFERAV
jgi:hypothetical protein